MGVQVVYYLNLFITLFSLMSIVSYICMIIYKKKYYLTLSNYLKKVQLYCLSILNVF